MKQKIIGKRYDYSIELLNRKTKSAFQILCLHKETNRKSAITNLNTIIGEIIEPVLKTNEIEDSIIDVNIESGKELFAVATDAFNDKHWVEYLENDLDEDLEQGGWNSET